MSATSGTLTSCLMRPKASAASMSGTEIRTMSTPAASRRLIWATVAATSLVSLLVMLCTAMGASPPTGTEPTQILRDTRRLIGDSPCMTLLSQLEASGLATGERRYVHRLAVVGHLRATGKAQTQRQRRLAALVKRISLTLQTTEQHFAVAIGDLRPAVSDEGNLDMAVTGDQRRRSWRRNGRRCRCSWRGGRWSLSGNGWGMGLGSWRGRCGWSRHGSSRRCSTRFRRGLLGGGRRFWRGLPFGNGLVFRLVQRVNLGGAVGAFDFDVLHGVAGQVLAALGG